jgi:hypothetical protein
MRDEGTVTLTERRSKCGHRDLPVILYIVAIDFRRTRLLMAFGSIFDFHSVCDLLAARGVIVSHQILRLWAAKFGRHFANEVRKRSAGKLGDKWYLDEMAVTIRGKKYWLWRAVDQDGFVLDVLVQSRRNARAANDDTKVPQQRCVHRHGAKGSTYEDGCN